MLCNRTFIQKHVRLGGAVQEDLILMATDLLLGVKGNFVTDRPELTREINVTNCGYWIKENDKKTWLNWHAGLAKVDVASVVVICFKINVEDVVLSIVFLVTS